MTCFFVTGATGAIGSALVPLLLEDPDSSVRLLLRARSQQEAEQRLAQLFEFWGLGAEEAGLRARVQVLRGDVGEPLLGVDEGAYSKLCAETTHMVHSAGIVKLNQALAEARRSAVDSTRHVLAFAEAARRQGPFEKLEFVSTVGVAGRTQGLVPEVMPLAAAGFHNTYEQAKSEAERLVVAKIESGLPVTVHRPSMVVGDSKTGKIIHFQVFYYLAEFFAGRKTFGIVPDTGEVLLDIIPADYVAQAIHASSGLPEAAGRVFHLCAGPSHAPRIADLTVQLRAIYASHNLPLPRLLKLPFGVYRRLTPAAARFAPQKLRPMLRSLPLFLDYLADRQVFDNANTTAFFSRHGIDAPCAKEYLGRIMGFYFQSKLQSERRGQTPA